MSFSVCFHFLHLFFVFWKLKNKNSYEPFRRMMMMMKNHQKVYKIIWINRLRIEYWFAFSLQNICWKMSHCTSHLKQNAIRVKGKCSCDLSTRTVSFATWRISAAAWRKWVSERSSLEHCSLIRSAWWKSPRKWRRCASCSLALLPSKLPWT